jgi:hypothetical protein
MALAQKRPVLPNPPSPRAVSPSSSNLTSVNAALGIGVMSNWAILSPALTTYEPPPSDPGHQDEQLASVVCVDGADAVR